MGMNFLPSSFLARGSRWSQVYGGWKDGCEDGENGEKRFKLPYICPPGVSVKSMSPSFTRTSYKHQSSLLNLLASGGVRLYRNFLVLAGFLP